ncbi:TIGR00645 family protein [Gilvimarinus sp. F26214L]|uniref:TIGR00645 family protein n=1 Tax=Gilvimarinus sp. DZF01 TaxID=3461371 RepID=UPI00404540FA
MSNKFERGLESTIFNSRWLLAPFFLGLIVSIVVLLIKFTTYLAYLVQDLFAMEVGAVVTSILTLVDLSLVGSLLLMIIFSGYEIFVSKIDVSNHVDRPDWMGKVDFSGLKLKVIGAIVAISAIELLKTFMEMRDADVVNADLIMWKVIIHMTFVVSGVLFAIMDKIAAGTKH